MTKRRSRGDGGLHWDEDRQRWIASVTVGYTPAGKRIVRKGSGKTKTEAHATLRQKVREYEDGLTMLRSGDTVAQAVEDWLTYGLNGRADNTVAKNRYLCDGHLIPDLGARKLRDLSAHDVDRWLTAKAKILSSRTLGELYSCLNRSLNRAMARDAVRRNVAALCTVPKGQAGRPSKSLTLDEAKAVVAAAEGSRIHAYVVVSLLTGARTEELRALTWANVDLVGDPQQTPPRPAAVQVWRSVRVGGDTKTRKSRRTLALPLRCIVALEAHRASQAEDRRKAGSKWTNHDLVFASSAGTELNAGNIRRSFRRVLSKAGIDRVDWTPRELRHSFVSLLSSNGVRLEDIADLCGHAGTIVTETVYRHELRPVLLTGAEAMNQIFADT